MEGWKVPHRKFEEMNWRFDFMAWSLHKIKKKSHNNMGYPDADLWCLCSLAFVQ